MLGTSWSLGSVLIVTLAVFLLHALVLRPWARRKFATAEPGNIAIRAGLNLAVNTSQLIWLMLAAGALLTWTVIWVATRFGGATADEIERAITRIATLRSWILSIESWGSVLLMALATAALLFWFYRQRIRRQADIETHLRQLQLEDLLHRKVEGKLEERAPSEQMVALAEIVQRIADEKSKIEKKIEATAPGFERQKLEAARDSLANDLEGFGNAYIVADLSRWLPDATVNRLDSEIEEPPRTWLQYIGRFFISGRLLGEISWIQRLALIANLLLVIPTVLAAAQSDIGARLESRLVDLRDLRVQTLASEEEKRLAAAIAAAEQIEPPATPQEDDDDDSSNPNQVVRIANKVGRMFESFGGDAFDHFTHKGGGPDGGGPRPDADIFEARAHNPPSAEDRKAIIEARAVAERYEARREVLAEASVVNKPGQDGGPPEIYLDPDLPKGPSSGGPGEGKIPGAYESSPKILVELSDLAGKPVTGAGRSMAADVEKLAKDHPSAYRALARAIRSTSAETFTQVARPAKVMHILFVGMLGGAAQSVTVDAFHPALTKYVAELADGPMQVAAYRLMSNGFLANLIKTKNSEKAFATIDRLAHAEVATKQVSLLRPLVEASLPKEADLSGTLRDLTPGLRQQSARVRNPAHVEAVENLWIKSLQRDGTEISEDMKKRIRSFTLRETAVSEFEHVFPPTLWQSAPTENASLAMATADVRRAHQFAELHRSSLVGGVLIGRDPKDITVDASISSLNWETGSDGILLKIGLESGDLVTAGPFHRAILHLALVYAADGRPLTVTIIRASPLDDHKIFLHPALLDTTLGCRAIRLDNFAFDALDDENSEWRAQSLAITVDRQLYELARLAVIEAVPLNISNDPTTERSRELRKNMLLEMDPASSTNEKYKAAITDALNNGILRPHSNGFLGRSDHFNAEITGLVKACTGGKDRNLSSYLDCLTKVAKVNFDRKVISKKGERWLVDAVAPVAQFGLVSGVREAELMSDRNLDFLMSGRDKILTFTMQAAFSTPPYQVLTTRWDELEANSDEVRAASEPFTLVLPSLEENILDYVESDPARLETLKNMQEFTALQRFFRMAFAGKLGEHFPYRSLGELAKETATTVRTQATPRWRGLFGDVEYLSSIGKDWEGLATQAKEVVGSCLKANSLLPQNLAGLSIDDLRRHWRQSEVLDDATWNKYCVFAPLTDTDADAKQAETYNQIVEQSVDFSEKRKVRRVLGVEASERAADPACQPLEN